MFEEPTYLYKFNSERCFKGIILSDHEQIATVDPSTHKLGGCVLITPEISEDEPIVIEIISIGKMGLAIGIGPESYPLENGIGID